MKKEFPSLPKAKLVQISAFAILLVISIIVIYLRPTPQASEVVTPSVSSVKTQALTSTYGELAIKAFNKNGAVLSDIYFSVVPVTNTIPAGTTIEEGRGVTTDSKGEAIFYSLPEGVYQLVAGGDWGEKVSLGDANYTLLIEAGIRRNEQIVVDILKPSPDPSATPTPSPRACANGRDDDKDDRIDLDDPGCTTANGSRESDTFYAPESVKATYNFGQMTIQFKDRTQDETKFYLYRAKGTSTQFDRVLGVDISAKTGINNTQSVKDTALPIDAEGTYAYAVTAAKSINGREVESNMSVQSVVQVPAYRPTAPTDIRATANNDNSVTVTFHDQSSDERGFTIYRTKDLNNNRWTWVDGLLAHTGRGAMTYTDTSLAADDTSTYWYTVTAYKMNSQGLPAESVIKTADAARVELKGANLPTPTNLRQQGKKGVNLFWDHTLEPNDASAGIVLERSVNNDTFQEIATLTAGSYGYRDKKAKKGRNAYRVRSYRDIVRDGKTTRIYSAYSNTITLKVN